MYRETGRRVAVIGLAQSARDAFVFERASLEREVARLRDDLEWVTRDRDRAVATTLDLTRALRDLQAATLARQEADAEVARLRRLRDAEWARHVARDPGTTVH
jgi:hypothetical protein